MFIFLSESVSLGSLNSGHSNKSLCRLNNMNFSSPRVISLPSWLSAQAANAKVKPQYFLWYYTSPYSQETQCPPFLEGLETCLHGYINLFWGLIFSSTHVASASTTIHRFREYLSCLTYHLLYNTGSGEIYK